MTWNLWWRFGPWSERQGPIAAVLEAQRPDLVGLQEVWVEEGGANQAEVLADQLGLHAAVGEVRFRDGLAFTNAVLSRWPLRSVEHQRLPRADGSPSHRQVVLAETVAPFGPVTFLTTHLDWPFDASADRVAQARALAALVAERRPDPASGFPAVLTGDLNAIPESDELRLLTGATAPPVPGLVLTDAWTVAGDGGPGHTWDRRNPHLADATWPQRRLDYVLVSWPRPKPLGSVQRCWLAGTEPVGGVSPSDHYAVVADLRTDRPPP
jgi:endonuclease/exonuclease/phosphatase family metal-dependent hydrolase